MDLQCLISPSGPNMGIKGSPTSCDWKPIIWPERLKALAPYMELSIILVRLRPHSHRHDLPGLKWNLPCIVGQFKLFGHVWRLKRNSTNNIKFPPNLCFHWSIARLYIWFIEGVPVGPLVLLWWAAPDPRAAWYECCVYSRFIVVWTLPWKHRETRKKRHYNTVLQDVPWTDV